MQKTLSWLLPILAITGHMSQGSPTCPWDDPQLEKWSEASSWPTGVLPGPDTEVTIPVDKKILLDGPIQRLLTLTIDGTLIWGDVDNIRLETSYILVNGEFHVGSEDCPFEKTADIFLYGKSNSNETVPHFGRKFVGAAPGSTLEIHGQQKLSWTKLVATVSPVTPQSCGFVYHSQDQNIKRRNGIWLNVWDVNGALVSLDTFDMGASRAEGSIPLIVDKINNMPYGSKVALAVQQTLGVSTAAYEDLYVAVESLGATKIRDVGDMEAYVLIAEKGQTTHTVEKHTARSAEEDGVLEASEVFTQGDLVYFASSYSELSKRNYEVYFKVLKRDAAFPKLSFLHNVTSWKPDDEVVVASTDFDWRQAEVKTIIDCTDCEPNQVRVRGSFHYSHYGEVTFGVDERGEVGLLSRNIRIEAELQPQCYSYTEKEEQLCELFQRDTFGGHTKVIGGAWARIEGVQLTNMGQQSTLATYPLHFHLCDAVPGQYLRNNVIRDSNSRCITIHGTDYLELSNNVCYNHLGHGIFLEDSAEQNNTIHRNLVIGTQFGTLLFTDMDTNNPMCIDRSYCALLSTYWITHPNNYFTENVAAGSDNYGFTFAFSDRPLGPSLPRMQSRGLYQDMSTRYMKVPNFSKNVMHSNKLAGLWFDNRLSYGQIDQNQYVPENAKMGLNKYSPRDPPNENGTPIETVLSELTMYKNEDRNAWLRCGNIVIENSTFADSLQSYVAAHTSDGTYCDVRHSIFIGETENKGEPYTHIFHDEMFSHLPKSQRPQHHFDRSIARNRPDFQMSGVQFYQGPSNVTNCWFDKFQNRYYNDSMVHTWGFRPMRPAAAINFHPNNHYPMVPRNGVSQLRFGFCDSSHDSFRVMDGNASTPWWTVFDGTQNIIFRDYDGSLTGTIGAKIVKDRPFFTGEKCLRKLDWGLASCPYPYVLMVIKGSGVLKKGYYGKTPVYINRDDHPEDVYVQTGNVGHKYNLRLYKSYTVKFNSEIGPPPRDVQFRPRFGLENNETIRFAVCLPKSTNTFTIYSRYPDLNPKRSKYPIWVDNLRSLDRDTTMTAFYWDKANGYLYFKMKSPYSFTRPGQLCAGDLCLEVNIKRDDGGDEPAICDTPVQPWYFKDRYPYVKNYHCHDSRDLLTAEGLGAPIETGFSPPPPDDQTC